MPSRPAATTTNTATTTAPAETWHALGCYQDLNNGARVFTQAVAGQVPGGSDAMTNAACQTTCQRLGFVFAGTEYYGECHCANSFNGDNGIQNTADCNTPCKGNPAEMCGGPFRVTAWGLGNARGPAPIPETTTTATTPAAPTGSPTKMGWKYLGCYTDLFEGVRTFNHDLSGLVAGGNANMTNEGCHAACLSRGYKYCGSEWSIECHGSNTIGGGNKLAASDDDCNMDCSGKAGEKCGGSARLSAWEYGELAAGDDATTSPPSPTTTSASATVAPTVAPTPTTPSLQWKALGCYSDGQDGRAFTNPQTEEVVGGFANMTNAGCTSTCQKLGFTFAGTEWSGECWCSLALHGSNGPVPLEDCNMNCRGNASEKCGSDFRLTAWELVAVESPASSTDTSTSTTTSDATESATTTTAVEETTTTSESSTATEESTTEASSATATTETAASSTETSTATTETTVTSSTDVSSATA